MVHIDAGFGDLARVFGIVHENGMYSDILRTAHPLGLFSCPLQAKKTTKASALSQNIVFCTGLRTRIYASHSKGPGSSGSLCAWH